MKLRTDLAQWQPKAVIFDCDGLLMDTEPCWTVAETEIFAKRGLPFGDQQKEQVIGKSIDAAADTMAQLFEEPGAGEAIQAELLELVGEVVAREAKPMAGAPDLVERVQKVVPVAVASNSPRALLNAALLRGGFESTFPVSLAADEVSSPKPAPDMYLRACEKLGVVPEEALAFEDSMTGLRSAQAAGIRLVGVPTLRGTHFPADVVVESLTDHTLNEWVASWS